MGLIKHISVYPQGLSRACPCILTDVGAMLPAATHHQNYEVYAYEMNPVGRLLLVGVISDPVGRGLLACTGLGD